MASALRKGTIFVLVLLFLLNDSIIATKPEGKDDPYKVLGVKQTATNEDIQKAYRQKAKETHPDKNPSPNANDEFRQVAAAFEILGNPINKQRHDNKIRQEMQRRRRARDQERRQEGMRRQQHDRERAEHQRKKREMVDSGRKTQSRTVNVSNLEEFEKKMLDSSRKYKTHCLIMFVANKDAEKKGEEEFYFPYPFAGEDGYHNPYESILQIAKVRFNAQTDLTRIFRAKSHTNTPHIILARKGDAVGNFQIFHPKRQKVDVHGEFKKWVESFLVIQATIANSHSLPVEFFIMRDGRVIYNESLSPNYQLSLSFRAGDRILAFDARLDTFPGATRIKEKIAKTKGVLLLDAVITSEGSYTIPKKRCYDLSTQCHDWTRTPRGKKNEQCQLNPEFMHHICPVTCGICSEHFASDLCYLAFHRPIHSFPSLLQSGVHSGRYFVDDIRNISKLRKNAAAAFFVVGLLVVFNIVLFKSAVRSSAQLKQSTKRSKSNLGMVLDSTLLIVAVTMCAGMKWMMSTSFEGVPSWLMSFHGDFIVIARYPDLHMVLLGVSAIAGVYFRTLVSCIRNGSMDAHRILLFIATLLALTGAMFIYNEFRSDTRWKLLWRYRKNAAFVIVVIGAFAGVGIVSLKRLSNHLQNKSAIPLILSNLVVLAAASSLVSMDPHFKADLIHVIELRKNAGFAFVVCGILTGHTVVKVLCRDR